MEQNIRLTSSLLLYQELIGDDSINGLNTNKCDQKISVLVSSEVGIWGAQFIQCDRN